LRNQIRDNAEKVAQDNGLQIESIKMKNFRKEERIQLVHLNADQIRNFRQKGKSDKEIVDSILAAMGSNIGYRHNL